VTPAPPDDFLPLHPDAFRILLVLEGGASHGYAIVKDLEAAPDRPGRVLPANLYRRIRTLRDQGLIEEVAPPDDEPDMDERRRYFGLTPLGLGVARAEARRLAALVERAGRLLGA
jgi:DNA-binding PadR family transcriptional regulator